MKDEAIKRLREEYEDLKKNPITNIGTTVGLPDKNNIFEWQVTMPGPKDTSYKGGLFYLKILFPENYPQHAPEVSFKTPIYHVNINPIKPKLIGSESLGHVCISTLNWWKPENKIREVLTNIFALFYMCNPDSPYGLDRADEFRFNRDLYEEKIKYFTKKYANPKDDDNINKEYDQDWDFSFNNIQ